MSENWTKTRQTLPPWIVKPAGDYAKAQAVRAQVQEAGIWTVCTEANCPNISECWAEQHCTFLILGNECTRSCGYCSVPKAKLPQLQDFARERAEVVRSIDTLGARYVVLTSPNRDDLPHGGAEAWALQVEAIHAHDPAIQVEVLIPDFDFDDTAWARLQMAEVTVLAHNVEAVPSLYPTMRPHGDFAQALASLARAKERLAEQVTKTALICGMGETDDELQIAIDAIAAAGVDILVLGQYLRPTPKQRPVARFLHPSEFSELADRARAAGIPAVVAGPYVRSSYKARQAWESATRARLAR